MSAVDADTYPCGDDDCEDEFAHPILREYHVLREHPLEDSGGGER